MVKHYVFIASLSVFVLIVIITCFKITGSPMFIRALKLDSFRIKDFDYIIGAVQKYYQDNNRLPNNLEQLVPQYIEDPNRIKDPETNKPYQYQATSDTNYQICTKFSTSSENKVYKSNYSFYQKADKHKKGYDCLKYTIPAKYLKASPSPKPIKVSTPSSSPINH